MIKYVHVCSLALYCKCLCFLVTDSTVLAYVLKKLNEEYNYGLKLILLSVDEGITGYRDDSLEVIKINFNFTFIRST